MLQLTKGQTDETIIVTLTELATLAVPFYLFIFTQVTTKQVVSFIKSVDDDASDYPERYNQFSINTSSLFDALQSGEWHYVVYEQDNDTNTDPTGLTVLEYGKMILAGTDFTYTQYNPSTTYKAYNG